MRHKAKVLGEEGQFVVCRFCLAPGVYLHMQARGY